MSELKPCPVCGALPCDQVELVRNTQELPREVTDALRELDRAESLAAEYAALRGDNEEVATIKIRSAAIRLEHWARAVGREAIRREALEEAATVADQYTRLPPLFNHGTKPSRSEEAAMDTAAQIALDIRALSPPVKD